MKDDQGNSQMQSQKLESELGYCKESNKNLKFEMSKQIILHKFEMSKQIILHKLIEQENHRSKDQNKKLEKTNEDIKKLNYQVRMKKYFN